MVPPADVHRKEKLTRLTRLTGRRWFRVLVTLALVVIGAALVPRVLCGRSADALFDGEVIAQEALAHGVATYVGPAAGTPTFSTGNARFDGEWTLVTYQMAALGLGQVVLAHPELKGEYLPVIDACVDRLLAADTTAFGTQAWGERGLDALGSDHGHAYLGYLNLALGMFRLLQPDNRFAAVHDRLTSALERRLSAAPHGVIETYPGETYPADVAAVVGSIGLHGRATGVDHRGVIQPWSRPFREACVDAESGLLIQAVDWTTGRVVDAPRASGTAIAVYFLSFADPMLSRDLFAALSRGQVATFLGFGGIREYAVGRGGGGDIDSGPVLVGVGISASGFAMAGARLYGDRMLYTRLYRTADLFGFPMDRGGGRRFMMGGPLGNAILLAMLTALREGS